MGKAKDYMGLVKLAEAAAARTASPVARNYWLAIAKENRRLAAEFSKQVQALQRHKDREPLDRL